MANGKINFSKTNSSHPNKRPEKLYFCQGALEQVGFFLAPPKWLLVLQVQPNSAGVGRRRTSKAQAGGRNGLMFLGQTSRKSPHLGWIFRKIALNVTTFSLFRHHHHHHQPHHHCSAQEAMDVVSVISIVLRLCAMSECLRATRFMRDC